MTYWQTYRSWLIRLLNERIYLSEREFCPDLLKLAVWLKSHIKFNGYRNDQKLAAFILRKQREIRIIIPTNKAHHEQTKKLEKAIELAETIQKSNSGGER